MPDYYKKLFKRFTYTVVGFVSVCAILNYYDIPKLPHEKREEEYRIKQDSIRKAKIDSLENMLEKKLADEY